MNDESEDLYRTTTDLEIERDDARLVVGAWLCLLPIVMSPAFTCCASFAPVAAILVMIPCLSRCGGTRFQAIQVVFCAVALAGFEIFGGIIAHVAGANPTWVAGFAAVVALVLMNAGLWMSHAGRQFVVPGVGEKLFKHFFEGQPRRPGRPVPGEVFQSPPGDNHPS